MNNKILKRIEKIKQLVNKDDLSIKGDPYTEDLSTKQIVDNYLKSGIPFNFDEGLDDDMDFEDES